MRQSHVDHLWKILYPIALYYVVYHVSYQLFLWCFGKDLGALACLMLAACVTIPFVYGIYRRIPPIPGWERLAGNESRAGEWLWVLLIVCLGIGLNVVLTHTVLPQWSQAYQSSGETLSAGTPLIRLLANGIVIPVLEELLYRGVLCRQLAAWYRAGTAVAVSALLFGIMHFNLVQFLYAFLMGLALGILYCKTKKIWLPIAAHGLTNMVVVVYSLLT